MSYNSYYGYPNYYYNNNRYNYNSSPGVKPLSGLTLDKKKREQEQKQKCLLAAVIILLLLLIGAIIAVVWLYMNKDSEPTLTTTASPDNSTTPVAGPDVGFMDVNMTATREDLTYGSDYADENQNAYQSLAQTTCYQITQTAAPDDYIVTNCTVTGMSQSAVKGVDIAIYLKVFIQNKTPAEAITGLGTTLAGIASPLVIDANNVNLA